MSSLDVRRLRPNRSTLAALVGVIFAVASGAVRDFVWADVRDGLMRLSDLPRSTRALVRAGFLLLLLMVALLLFGEVLRGSSELVATFSGSPTRGQQLPLALFPISLFVISVAWAFLLAGALHAHWGVRVFVVTTYLALGLGWSSGILAAGQEMFIHIGLVAAVPAVFLVRSRARPRPAAEFVGLLVLVAATYAFAQYQSVQTFQTTGAPAPLAQMSLQLAFLRGFVTPLLVLVGLDVADFIYRGSGWVAGISRDRLHRFAVPVLFVAVLAWRGKDIVAAVVRHVGEAGAVEVAVQYVGALGIPAVVVAVWFLVSRRGDAASSGLDEEALVDRAQRSIPALAVAFKGWLVAVTFGYVVLFAVQAFLPQRSGVHETFGAVVDWLAGAFGRYDEPWQILFAAVCVAAAIWAVRTGRKAMALYLGVLGLTDVWYRLAAETGPLRALAWESFSQVNALLTLSLVVAAVVWLLRGALTQDRLYRLLLLAVVTAMLAPAAVIGDPFSPFFAFAGVAFIAFGILWDALTSGSWANEGTSRLPRTSRIFLYLGYVLFTVTLINWALVSHDLDGVAFFTGDAASQGFTVFGKPLLFALFAVTLLGTSRTATSGEGA